MFAFFLPPIYLIKQNCFCHSGEAYVKLNQFQEGKKHFKRSSELTKNELPNIDLARLYLLDDMIPEARNAYTAALK